MNHTRPSHRDVSSHMVSSDCVIYHDHFTLHSLEHNHGHVSRISKLFCLRSLSRSAYSCVTGAVDGGFWCVPVGNGRGWHSPRHKEELTGLRKSCSRGWASASIWNLGFGRAPPIPGTRKGACPNCAHSVVSAECCLSFWGSGIWVCARQPAPNTTPEHRDSKECTG